MRDQTEKQLDFVENQTNMLWEQFENNRTKLRNERWKVKEIIFDAMTKQDAELFEIQVSLNISKQFINFISFEIFYF